MRDTTYQFHADPDRLAEEFLIVNCIFDPADPAYDGMKQLTQTSRFIMPERCKQAIAQYRRQVNPARAFLLDNHVETRPHVKRGAKYLACGFTADLFGSEG